MSKTKDRASDLLASLFLAPTEGPQIPERFPFPLRSNISPVFGMIDYLKLPCPHALAADDQDALRRDLTKAISTYSFSCYMRHAYAYKHFQKNSTLNKNINKSLKILRLIEKDILADGWILCQIQRTFGKNSGRRTTNYISVLQELSEVLSGPDLRGWKWERTPEKALIGYCLPAVYKKYFGRLAISRKLDGELSGPFILFIRAVLDLKGIRNERVKPFGTEGLRRLLKEALALEKAGGFALTVDEALLKFLDRDRPNVQFA